MSPSSRAGSPPAPIAASPADPVREEPTRRGRPRSEATRAAILRAAGDLLLERDLATMSMDAVARRAGASKATIYRWWSSKEGLALDALFSEWEAEAPPPPDTGALADDLLGLVLPWAGQLTARPYARVVAAFVTAAQSSPEFARTLRERFVEPRRAPARAAFARAVERGEADGALDLEAAVDLLYGPFYHRLLQRHAPLDEVFARTIVDLVVRAVRDGCARRA